MKVERTVFSPAEKAEMENAKATVEANRAYIDYIAMMADIEIPTEEGGYTDEPEI